MLASPYLNTKPTTAAALAASPADLTVVVASDESHGCREDPRSPTSLAKHLFSSLRSHGLMGDR